MAHDHIGRAEPVDHGEDLRTMNAELLRTADELIENLSKLVAMKRRLVQDNHRLRQERAAIKAALDSADVPRDTSDGEPV
jgi:hypothetical protein